MPSARVIVLRSGLVLAFCLALAFAQFRETLRPSFAATLELITHDADSGRTVPARVYLFKDGRPFRFSPVDSLLALRVDLFYREVLWRRAPDPATLEVTANGESHFLLLRGTAAFDLPAGRYRVEAYRGLFYKPAVQEFELRAGGKQRIELDLAPLKEHEQWLSGDDHIHLVRHREDDPVFLGWIAGEDLSVGNFLQLQRQQDAAMQYGFGDAAEARREGRSIRSGMEARSHFYGHVNLLGPREILRPLSIGEVYANSREAYPFPTVLFTRARSLGATVGYAHFDGSQKNSTLLMDLALGSIDFIEVFQFGVLKTEAWYELLNAGFRVTGIAGSDFPVPLNNRKPWPRSLPLLGPERTLVKAAPKPSAYAAWAAGVRTGRVVVSNGPLLDLTVDGSAPGAVIKWSGGQKPVEGEAVARYHRPLEKLEIMVNGKTVASIAGEGRHEVRLPFRLHLEESSWIAARATSASQEGEPEIQAHTNPVYLLREGRHVSVNGARRALLLRWQQQAGYYRSPDLEFSERRHREGLLSNVEKTLAVLGSE